MMQVKKEIFSQFFGNKEVYLYTITTPENESIQITNFGGIVHSWSCKDKGGKLADILLGCRAIPDYLDHHPYFGSIIGRYANRIAHGKFSLDGKTYTLPTNLGHHHLHGGHHGFDRKVWSSEILEYDNHVKLILTSTSCDGEEGYPGNLNIKTIYTYTAHNELIIEYFANSDQSTPINLSNHCYFNLSGHQNETILDHLVNIRSQAITAADDESIPTGHIIKIKNTILDFSILTPLAKGLDILSTDLIPTKGYDHNYILDAEPSHLAAAIVIHPTSGRRLSVYTDQPAIQLYTGNWLSGVNGKYGTYRDHSGLCLETQHFPDSPNHPTFPNTILRPNEQYYSKTTYKMDVKEEF
jgi:aldose 1-epimerase